MAKFCKFCGSPLEEGQACTCPKAQAAAQAAPEAAPAAAPAPEAAPVATAAPAAAPAAGNEFLKKLKDTLLGYWKAPKAAAAAAAEDKQGMAVAGVFAGVNFLAVFFFLWRMLGQLINIIVSAVESVGEAFTGMMGIMGSMMGGMSELGDLGEMSEAMDELDIAWPIMPMLVSGLIIAALGIAISALVLFVAAKINKQSVDFKGLILTQSVHTIVPSALLIVGLVLGLISWELQVLMLALILVQWFANIFVEIRDTANVQVMESGKTMTIQTLVITVALALAVFAISKLFGWCVEEYFTAFGEAVMDAMKDGLGDIFG